MTRVLIRDGRGVAVVGPWEGRAAVAAFAAAVFALAAHGLGLFVYSNVGDASVWVRVPGALWFLVVVGVPTVGGALLRDARRGRRQVGSAVVASFGLPIAAFLPGNLVWFPRFEMEPLVAVHFGLSQVFMICAGVAAVFAALALVGDPDVGWRDPRSTSRSLARAVVLFAIAFTALTLVAPTTRGVDDGLMGGMALWFHGAFVAGLDLAAVGRVVLEFLIPGLAILIVAVAAAGARPVWLTFGAGAVVAVGGLMQVINEPVMVATHGEVLGREMELTVWYWVHAAAVVALVGALVTLWAPTRDAMRGHRTRGADVPG